MKSALKRQNFILDLLLRTQKLSVQELSKQTGVSSVTIRKDLDYLENRKIIRRIQGYAQLNNDTPMHIRLATDHSVKQAIAKKAANLVNNGDTIIIESGSSCILLADELNQRQIYATVITNSIFMSSFLGHMPTLHLVILGGEYQADSMAVVGPLAKKNLSNFHAKYFFSGIDGYSVSMGFSGDNLQRADLMQFMAAQSDKLVILAESTKFTHKGTLPLYPPDAVDILITNQNINDNPVLKSLSEQNTQIQIITA